MLYSERFEVLGGDASRMLQGMRLFSWAGPRRQTTAGAGRRCGAVGVAWSCGGRCFW